MFLAEQQMMYATSDLSPELVKRTRVVSFSTLPYNPNLDPSDFYVFGPMKSHFVGDVLMMMKMLNMRHIQG